MKVKPTDGNQHRIELRPAGKISKKPSSVGTQALAKAIYKPAEFNAENKIPNVKVANRVTKVAFRQFAKENKPNR